MCAVISVTPCKARPGWRAERDHRCAAGGPANAVYLPTGALQFLEALARARPRHLLIAADFDHLPDVTMPGLNAPLVSQTVRAPTHVALEAHVPNSANCMMLVYFIII